MKRKGLDDAILTKAKLALGLPLDNEEDAPAPHEDKPEPTKKWRKPRHDTEEGQIYVKNKAKQKEESDTYYKTTPKTSSKKKSKSRKKKTAASVKCDVLSNDCKNRHKTESISFLQLWNSNREVWKFEKLKQTWLLKNSLDAQQIDEKVFEMLLTYIASVKGAARQATLTEMHRVISNYEQGNTKQTVETLEKGSDEEALLSISQDKYDRARQIIQILSDV